MATDYRISPSETRYDAADVRALIRETLNTAPAVERVQELLVRHVSGENCTPQSSKRKSPGSSRTSSARPPRRTGARSPPA